jgi:hypothetical protein
MKTEQIVWNLGTAHADAKTAFMSTRDLENEEIRDQRCVLEEHHKTIIRKVGRTPPGHLETLRDSGRSTQSTPNTV